MITCKNCGMELNESAAFCKNCGCKVESGGRVNLEDDIREKINKGVMDATEKAKEGWKEGSEKAKEGLKIGAEKAREGLKIGADKGQKGLERYIEKCRENKMFLAVPIAILSVLVMIIIIGGIVAGMDKKIDVTDCIEVSLSGYNKSGSAKAYILYDKLQTKCLQAKGVDVDEDDIYYEWEEHFKGASLETFIDCIHLSQNESDNLCNGDVVVVELKYDNERLKEYGIKFVGVDYKYIVEGLEALQPLDPFDGLTVTFEGIAPNVDVSMEYDGSCDLLDSNMFYTDEYDSLNKGEEITVYFELDEYDAQSNGYDLTQTSKKYTCNEVDTYLSKAENLSDSALNQMQEEARDCIDVYLANNFNYISGDTVHYEGSYVLVNKENSSAENQNYVYIIHSVQVSSKETYAYDNPSAGVVNGDPLFASSKVYMPICFKNVICKYDGDISYEMESYIQGTTELGMNNNWDKVDGYTDADKMQQELVVSSKIDYTAEITGNLQNASSADNTEGSAEQPTSEQPESQQPDTNEDYILPNSSTEYVKESVLDAFSKRELRLARNEIYARHGRKFDDEELSAYFEGKSWYSGTIDGDDFNDDMLNVYEKDNIKLIKKLEGID